jgi:hypothetical protein
MDEEMDEYLKSVVQRHRQEMRRKLIDEMERRQQMGSRKTLRIVYVLAALLCISALAIAGIAHWKYHFWGKVNGKYVFTTVPEKTEMDKDGNAVVRGGSIVEISSTDPNYTLDRAKQTADRLSEVNLLREQGKRELCRVIEIEVEGEVGRTYNYRYVLADGSEVTTGEGGEYPSEKVHAVLGEAVRLRLSGKGELTGTKEEEVKGTIFAFERYKLTLNDGRVVILSIGTPKIEK